MRCGSLFTGIRGLDMALEWAGHETAWMCEKDVHARRVLEARYPDVPLYGDVTELDFNEVEPVELLIGGGFPCQPFSSAGKRKGGDDERFLWSEVARAVRTLRPRVVVLENVADILRFGNEYGLILGDLAEAGYVTRWGCLRASDIGAPHGRNRWFAVAHADSWRLEERSQRYGLSAGGLGAPRRDNPDRRHAALENAQSDQRRSIDGERQATPDSECQGRERSNGRSEQGWRAVNGASAGERDWGDYGPAISRWERVLMRSAPAPLAEGKLSPHFVTWMMGLPDEWAFPLLSRSQALKCLGNAVVPHQGFYALTRLGLPVELWGFA